MEETEAITTYDVLCRASLPVTLVSTSKTLHVKGAHGLEVKTQVLMAWPSFRDAESLILPGGMQGVNNLWDTKRMKEILNMHTHKDTLIAAICAAPIILGRLELLSGKTATCYPGLEGELKGATTSNEAVVEDGNIITSRGPATATAFALKIVEHLSGKEVAEKVAQGMLYGLQ
ncbi:MAG TPA: DJ-1 family protein [Porphyromonadaceae bacterium]|nr:DJ-1 family protein [Porphyromonadaceae bacterium]